MGQALRRILFQALITYSEDDFTTASRLIPRRFFALEAQNDREIETSIIAPRGLPVKRDIHEDADLPSHPGLDPGSRVLYPASGFQIGVGNDRET